MARGTIVEKDGDYDDIYIPQLKFKRGNIVCLQNLLPGSENEEQASDVYCHQSSLASVAPLDLKYLKYLLEKDNSRIEKLWTILAHRMIIIYHEFLPRFHVMTQDRVRDFCKVCTVKVYKPGEFVDIYSGGVIFRGSLSQLKQGANEVDKKLKMVDQVNKQK